MSLQVKLCVINLSCSWRRDGETPLNKLQEMSKSDSSHCGQESYDITPLLNKCYFTGILFSNLLC